MATVVNPPRDTFYLTVKRVADVCISVCLLALFAPLFAIVAIIIAVESKGGVFFRQVRVGKNGRHFRIIKFRTMVANAESLGPQITAAADERMTRLGRLLRATKIDELPQLANVLIGDMSLVGPRPQVPRYVRHFPPAAREVILSVLPGITGPTAILFRHEESILDARPNPETFYVDVLVPIKCELDMEYVRRQSFWNDLRALCATVGLIVRGIVHRILRRPIGRSIELSQRQTAVIEQYNSDHLVYTNFSESRAVIEFAEVS
jgi:lipopolysaccharide/colanic/teichoic acid biosynthesis glycosyltransferase